MVKNIIRCKRVYAGFKEEPAACYVFEQAGKQMNLRNAGQWYATMEKNELADLMQREPGLRRTGMSNTVTECKNWYSSVSILTKMR